MWHFWKDRFLQNHVIFWAAACHYSLLDVSHSQQNCSNNNNNMMMMMMLMCKAEVSRAVLPTVKCLFKTSNCGKTLSAKKSSYRGSNFTLFSWNFIYHLWRWKVGWLTLYEQQAAAVVVCLIIKKIAYRVDLQT